MRIKSFLFFGILFGSLLIEAMSNPVDEPTSWNTISLPPKYAYPSDLKTNVYATEFPTYKKAWFHESDCDKYRSTSIRWVSDSINNMSGMSFKGLVYKLNLGSHANEFAVFFHEKRCYDGEAEYGGVFPENSREGFFYLCGDCNLTTQNWCQWPGDCKAMGDCAGVEKALKDPFRYKKLLRWATFLLKF